MNRLEEFRRPRSSPVVRQNHTDRPVTFLSASMDDEMRACLPHLRAFARSLTCDGERADSLVQDTLLKATSAASRFTPGENFRTWVFAILRSLYFSRSRAAMRSLRVTELETNTRASVQRAGLVFGSFQCAFDMLPALQREVLVLVDAEGFRYEEVAAISGCTVGRIRSRVARARSEIRRLLGAGGIEPPGIDRAGARIMPRRSE